MDQVEKLVELYKATQAPSERKVLLDTVRISSPDTSPHLEERIFQEHVRGMTIEELVRLIAAHRDVSIEQAGELLRDTILQHLLQRSKLNPLVPITTRAAPHTAQAGTNDRGVNGIAVKDPHKGKETTTAPGEISQPKEPAMASVPPKPAAPLPQLSPRGIGG